MENDNVKPSYEELQQAYQQLLQQAQELDRRYQALLQDKMLDKIKVVCGIMEHKDVYSEEIIKLAEWHLAQMLAKPEA
jgi:hypothetical protein